MNPCWEDIFNADINNWEERYRWEFNQDHLVFKSNESLVTNYRYLYEICLRLQKNSVYLITIVATDERNLEDGCYKLYYVFSQDRDDQFLILEYPLQKFDSSKYLLSEQPLSRYLKDGRVYPSIRKLFATAASFEREIFDLFDLVAVHHWKRVKG